MSRTRIYRFRNHIMVSVGQDDCVPLDHEQAAAVAIILARMAQDVRKVPYAESTMAPLNILAEGRIVGDDEEEGER